MNTCIVIPYHNHPGAIGQVVAALRPLGLPCRIVDDGSDAPSQEVLARLASRESWVTLQRLPVNQGKGAAVMAGCDAALAQGFTHALQIDADGQHDVNDVPRLLELSRQRPSALISGQAVYDDSVPRSRLYGRYITHFWVWVNTLSLEIRDSMCGLRVYPLAQASAIWRKHHIGRRMDFDTEIMVRLSWSGVAVINVPTRVTYPMDGVSHFKMLRDNLFISAMHTRLFFGMLWRIPMLLGRRLARRTRGAEA
jgi:glycosyltransferase involved in cell wall biosynthesis